MKIEMPNEVMRAVLDKLKENMVFPEKTREDKLCNIFIYKLDYALFCRKREEDDLW